MARTALALCTSSRFFALKILCAEVKRLATSLTARLAVVYQIDGNLSGYLPTKYEPANGIIDFDIAVPMIYMSANKY